MKNTLCVILFALFASAVFADTDEMIIVPIGRTPTKVAALKTEQMRAYSVQDAPLVLLMTVGMTGDVAPRYDFSITATYDTAYRKGSPVWLYAIVANFEATSQRLGVQYKVIGGKNFTVKQSKTFRGSTIYAIFIRKPLAPKVSIYQLQVALSKGSNVFDTLISRFIVANTY